MPFTPYTLLVVHERQLLRIPVIKHRPVPIIRNLFTQSGTFRAKDSFSLAASPGDKMVRSFSPVNNNEDVFGLALG